MNYLGLDYGQSHIGVAVATGPLAEPLTIVSAQNPIHQIKDLIKKYYISTIVVGDAHASMHDTYLGFIKDLKNLNLPVHEVDETLSSHDARQSLLHTTQSKRRDKEHAAAAAIILQSYLDNK